MKELSDDAKVIAASNLTLAFFIREHTLHSGNPINLREDSKTVVDEFFKEFLDSLDQ